MLKKILNKYITIFTLVSLIIPSTLLNLVNIDKAHANGLPNIVINEVMVDPDTGQNEWVELYNKDAVAHPITGYSLVSIGAPLYVIGTDLADPTLIPANGYAVISRSGSKFVNSGDDLTLQMDDGATALDQITYGTNPSTNFLSAPSKGKTIGRVGDGQGCWYGNLNPSIGLSNNDANLALPTWVDSTIIAATGDNPINFINNITKNSVTVASELSAYQDSSLTAYLIDANRTMVSSTITATTNQIHQEFTLNASSLIDGSIVPWLKITDTATGIFTEYAQGTPGSKDTIIPDAPTAASVKAGSDNAANFINLFNKFDTTVTVTLSNSPLLTDTIHVDLSDSSHSALGSVTEQSTTNVNIFKINPSTLDDGTVTVNAFVVDQAGNSSANFTGSNALKDTIKPTTTINLNNTYGPFTWADKISGTATDATSGIDGVAVSLQRNSDNKYYNGTDWHATEYLLNTTYLTGNWEVLVSSNVLEHNVNYTVRSYALDLANNSQDTATSKTFTYDTSTPAGSFTLNDDSATTSGANVTLKMTASADATFMRFSNDNITWSSWGAFATTKTWALSANDGNKTVYAQFKNNAGNTSAVSSKIITLDTNAPTGTVFINSNDEFTNNKTVTLTLAATDLTSGMDKMKFSNNGTTWSSWEAYNTSKTWDLLSTTYSVTNEGVKTVYVMFKDKAGNETSATISDTITYDVTAPINGTLSIDSGATVTSLGTVTLTLSATDATSGMDKMKFSNDNTTWSTAEAYTTSKTAWVLTTGDGVKTIYVKYLDKAGNETSEISKSITKDTTGPVGTISINSSANYTKSRTVTLNLSATDLSTVTHMAFSDNGTDFTTWEAFTASKTYTLPEGDGSKTVYAKFKDQLGFIGLIVSDSIIMDTTTPSDPSMKDSPNGQSLTKGDSIKLSGTAEAGSLITIRVYSDAVYTEYVYADTNGNWSHTISSDVINSLETGDHKITLTVTDLAGNVTGERQIAAFTLNDKVDETVTTFVNTPKAVAQEDKTDEGTEVTTIGPENGDTKGDEDDKTKTTRTLVTLAILIIAVGAIAGGYYGYEWWMQKENTNKKKTTTKKTNKNEKFGRW